MASVSLLYRFGAKGEESSRKGCGLTSKPCALSGILIVNEMHKIMLIQPPYTLYKSEPKGADPPLGLAYIAAVLENSGYTVSILDAVVEGFNREEFAGKNLVTYGLSFEEIEERIRDFDPDYVGISCLFSTQSTNAHRICGIAKRVNPNIITVMGGAHPSALPAETLKDENVDFVVIGEGEYTFRDLIGRLKDGQNYSELEGIAYREDGSIVVRPKTSFIENLDEIPLPARHLLPMEKYFNINRPHGVTRKTPNTPMITSRGCSANCVFCSVHTVWGKRFRARSPENVLGEIKHLIDTYGVREIHFEDDNLTLDKERAKEIFQGIVDNGFDIVWTTPNGVAAFALDEEMLPLLKKSGCYKLYLAIESGDEEILHKVVRKPLDLRRVRSLVKTIKKIGISVDAFFVVGFPGETKEQIGRTFRFARGLNLENAFFFIATPYPGTDLYELCQREGHLVKDFSLENLRVGKASIRLRDFSPEELERLVARETLKYRLRSIKNPLVFFRRVILRFFKDPRFALEYALKSMRKSSN